MSMQGVELSFVFLFLCIFTVLYMQFDYLIVTKKEEIEHGWRGGQGKGEVEPKIRRTEEPRKKRGHRRIDPTSWKIQTIVRTRTVGEKKNRISTSK